MMIKWLHPTSTPPTPSFPYTFALTVPKSPPCPRTINCDRISPTPHRKSATHNMAYGYMGRRYPLTKCTHIYTGTLTVLYKSITPWRPAPIAVRVRCKCSSPTAQVRSLGIRPQQLLLLLLLLLFWLAAHWYDRIAPI